MNAIQEDDLNAGELLRMVEASACSKAGEQARLADLLAHRAAIQEVAATLHLPAEEIAHVYCAELANLCSHAAITDFLPVLVAKRVRARYRQNKGSY